MPEACFLGNSRSYVDDKYYLSCHPSNTYTPPKPTNGAFHGLYRCSEFNWNGEINLGYPDGTNVITKSLKRDTERSESEQET